MSLNYEASGAESDRRSALWGINWPGHPNADGDQSISIVVEPERWKLLAVTSDPDADYSYDDLALMERDDGEMLLLRTSGCSCPSPTETWGEVCSGTLADALAACRKERAQWRSDFAPPGPWAEMLGEIERIITERKEITT